MPTFRSIGLHPELRSRLVTRPLLLLNNNDAGNNGSDCNNGTSSCNGPTPNASSFEDENPARRRDGDDGEQSNDDDNDRNRNRNHLQPVETPRALLSRNPATLRLLRTATATTTTTRKRNRRAGSGGVGYPAAATGGGDVAPLSASTDENVDSDPIPPSKAKSLRREVAKAMVDRSVQGRIVATLAAVRRASEAAAGAEEGGGGDRPPSSTSAADSKTMTMATTIPGTASALALLLECESSTNGHLLPLLLPSTGCAALDELVAMPPECARVSTTLDLMTNRHCGGGKTFGGGGGGIPYGYVTQFSGPPSSGKTQIAIRIAASPTATASSQLPGSTPRVWYLCSDSSLSSRAQRLEQVAHYVCRQSALSSSSSQAMMSQMSQNSAALGGGGVASLASITSRTEFVSVPNRYRLLAQLAAVESELLLLASGQRRRRREEEEHGNTVPPPRPPPPGILILDSASGCLGPPSLGGGGGGGQNDATTTTQQKVAHALKRLARQHGMAVIVINGSVPVKESGGNGGNGIGGVGVDAGRTSRAALGRAWKETAADIDVWVEALPDVGGAVVHQATLERHPAKPCFLDGGNVGAGHAATTMKARFRIDGSGIRDAGP